MQYPLLGFSMPSAVNPVEYLTKLTQNAATPHPSSEIADGHETPSAESSRKFAKAASRQEMHDRAEILGDDAMLEKVQQKNANNRKSRKAKKKHSAKSKKKRIPAQTTEEEGTSETESKEESSTAKALHDIENAVVAPFGGGKEKSTFNNATIKTTNAQQQKVARPLEDPYSDSGRRIAFSTNTKDKDDEDDDDRKTNEFSHKCGGTCSHGDDDDEEEQREECTECKKGKYG